MTITTRPPRPSGRGSARAFARRSWLMLALFALDLLVTTVLGIVFLALLGLHEGDLLLMAHNTGGWAAELFLTVLVVAPPAAGVVLAAVALRRGARGRTWLSLALNAACTVWSLYLFADTVRMSYLP